MGNYNFFGSLFTLLALRAVDSRAAGCRGWRHIPNALGSAEGNLVILIFTEWLVFDSLGLRLSIKHPK